MADPGSKFNPKNPDAWGVGNVQYLLAPALGVVLLVGEYDLKIFCLFHRHFQLSLRVSVVEQVEARFSPCLVDLLAGLDLLGRQKDFEKYIQEALKCLQLVPFGLE